MSKDGEYGRLMAEADKLSQKAQEQFDAYMDSGSQSTLRSYERNRQRADDLRTAAQAKRHANENAALRGWVMKLRDMPEESLADEIERMAAAVSDGTFW